MCWVFLRSVFEAVHRESGAREAALLGARKPDETLPTLYVIGGDGSTGWMPPCDSDLRRLPPDDEQAPPRRVSVAVITAVL